MHLTWGKLVFLAALCALFAAVALSADTSSNSVMSLARFRNRRQADESEMSTKEMIAQGKKGIEKLAKGAKDLIDVGQSAVKILSKIAAIMQGFGPAMAAAGMVISLLTAFLPEQESAELKYMKEQFEIVNTKLDVVTSRLDDIDMSIEYNGAKVSFGPYSRKITALMRNLKFVIEAPDAKRRAMNQEFFVHSFVKTYEDSAHTLYNALMGKESSFFGYDLLDVTMKKVKCNIQKVFQFCTLSGKLIKDAITVEGAYFGFKNMTYRVETEGKKWEDNMKQLGKRCQDIVKKCSDDWKTYATPLIDQTYNANAGRSNAEMASAMFKKLSENLPQRAWGVWVYNDVWGFGDHTVSNAKSQMFMKWHKHNKIVSVDTVAIGNYFDVERAKKALLKTVSDIPNCKLMPRKDPASRLVTRMSANFGGFRGGVYYAVAKGKGLEFRITEKHFLMHNVDKSACGNRYNHHMFIYH